MNELEENAKYYCNRFGIYENLPLRWRLVLLIGVPLFMGASLVFVTLSIANEKYNYNFHFFFFVVSFLPAMLGSHLLSRAKKEIMISVCNRYPLKFNLDDEVKYRFEKVKFLYIKNLLKVENNSEVYKALDKYLKIYSASKEYSMDSYFDIVGMIKKSLGVIPFFYVAIFGYFIKNNYNELILFGGELCVILFVVFFASLMYWYIIGGLSLFINFLIVHVSKKSGGDAKIRYFLSEMSLLAKVEKDTNAWKLSGEVGSWRENK